MKTIIVGDFNEDLLGQNHSHIDNICQLHGLTQIITQATRITANTSTLIDLVFVSSNEFVEEHGILPPCCSDHCAIYVVLKFKKKQNKCHTRKIYNYNQADFDGLQNYIQIFNWDNIFANNDVNTIAELMVKTISNCIDEFIPHKLVTIRQNDTSWMNGNIRTLMRKRNRLHIKAKNRNMQRDWELFREARNKVISSIRKAKYDYNTKLDNILNNKHGSKTWWQVLKRYIKQKDNSKSAFPPIENNGVLYESDDDIANVMNNYFVNQATVDKPDEDVPMNQNNIINQLKEIQLQEKEVEDILLSLNERKASGPDLINNKIIKKIGKYLAKPLTKLFNLSLFYSTYPTIWKQSLIVPIHKKGSIHLCSNYRPVALTSCLSKVFETCVMKHISNFFLDNKIITHLQSGFRPGDSTVYQLTDLYNYIPKAMDDGKEVKAVFCDISKAFDRVWHKGLLYKLQGNGINGKLILWFKSYLEKRKQKTVINGFTSDNKSVLAGVPQGSVLGPLLFLVYINDIVDNISCNIKLFADDTSLYITLDDYALGYRTLNSDLRLISDWADKWQVKFSTGKTESITFSRKVHSHTHPDLYLGDSKIKDVKNHKHLGLTFQNDGQWHCHIEQLVSKVGPMINCFRSLKYRLNRKTLEKLYKSYILPLFDYCDYIWDNCNLGQVDILEQFQLDALRTICGAVRGTNHNKIYNETGFIPLIQRRKFHKTCTFYKMIKGMTPNYLSSLVPPTIMTITNYPLRNADELKNIRTRTELYKKSFLPSAVRDWNALDINIRKLNSFNQFKKAICPLKKLQHKYFVEFGSRSNQIIHCRLRLDCSDLNAHRFTRHISNNSYCSCGHPFEDTVHFLFCCPLYNHIRPTMFYYYRGFDIKAVLFGNNDYPPELNLNIVQSVHNFIILSKRFTL